ncbi:MAG: glycine--tRNA ligase, partial [Proteobacteria bacterium]|nr:glycine--tRNA ligase [Pseudomonadota bacterium]
AGFSDPLVDCLNCKERFRGDKAPRLEVNSPVSYHEGGKNSGKKLHGSVKSCGYVCPVCGSPELSDERQFNGMFRSTLGPVDPMADFFKEIKDKNLSERDMRALYEDILRRSLVYLRPETAQAMFVQFLNVLQTTSMKVPFGIAQQGKSFRNEIVVEHFIFRSCEFEQMEMEFFIEPGTQQQWLDYWTKERISWYHKYSNSPDSFRLRQHDKTELAHYSDDCYDIEYLYPWGWGELEGVASRTDYDLKRHAAATGSKLSYFEQNKLDPETGKQGWRFVPYVIEPAAGLTRTLLALMLDAYYEERGVDSQGQEKVRTMLRLHPAIAPIKAAILPLVKKDGQPELASEIAKNLRQAGLNVSYDEAQSIGKRYAKHDEIGTPFCITVDPQSIEDQTVTLRYRDSAIQERLPIAAVIAKVVEACRHP